MTPEKLWRVLLLNDVPLLIHGPDWAKALAALPRSGSVALDVLDLDTGVDAATSTASLRQEVIRRWSADSTLIVTLGTHVEDRVLPVLFDVCQRSVRINATEVKRFEPSHRLVAFAPNDEGPAASLFPLRIAAARLASGA